ncbi:AAA-domain-containing protein [Aulographum hederae CBS 113979]|uniref:AAA-domain-containing protein n=1 Tax=Aulographum hederae CBS 113979 TaxID=1176131 RepID=A0A6G1H2K9_9PEZI|nr:AAA-domain-containing protein [Aulographum hederae CBS 113979]
MLINTQNMESPKYKLRLLPNSPTTLEGAFRVHLPSNDLNKLGIRPDEPCLLKSDGRTGIAIAWRSTLNGPIAQISTIAKDAYGFSLEDRITVSKCETQLRCAEKVVFRDVTEGLTANDHVSEDHLRFSVASHCFLNVDMIVAGGFVEVTPRKNLRKGRKRRFIVEAIEPVGPEDEAYLPYDFTEQTQVEFRSEPSPMPSEAEVTPQEMDFDFGGIAGLDRQLAELQERLRTIPNLHTDDPWSKLFARFTKNEGILLHGHPGTGKTMILDCIARARWKKVVHIDKSVSSRTSKTESSPLKRKFQEALENSPSVIVMDNLDRFAGNTESSVDSMAQDIVTEMQKLQGTTVHVIAATRNPNEIDSDLRSFFRHEIEIPIPDSKSRTAILKATLQDYASDDIIAQIGDKTHGFVGSDLERLTLTAVDRLKSLHFSDPFLTQPLLSLDDFSTALLTVRPTAMREVFLELPKVSWSDIAGSSLVKQALYEVIELPFTDPDLFRRYRLSPRKGILLYGPPGCSKTLTARAIATSSSLNFLAVKGAELTSMYVGETERALRAVFSRARTVAPAVIFFDEIDALGVSRGEGGSGGSSTKGLNVLTTLLNEMDGIEALKGVLVLAATNRPDMLDPALLRPGRFDASFYVGLPDKEARRQIVEMRMRERPVSGDVDVGAVSGMTEGHSGAEVVEICERATLCALRAERERREEKEIKMIDFEEGVKSVSRGITPEMLEGFRAWEMGRGKGVVGLGGSVE